MTAIDHPLIDRFLEALWLEKGLSENTRMAYRSDLAHFNAWLVEREVELQQVGENESKTVRTTTGHKTLPAHQFLP